MCLLNFSGFSIGGAEAIPKKMAELTPWVRAFVDADENALVTPDTYEHTSTLNLPIPVSASLVPMLIVVVGLFLLVGAVNYHLFREKSKDMNQALDTIASHAPANANKPATGKDAVPAKKRQGAEIASPQSSPGS